MVKLVTYKMTINSKLPNLKMCGGWLHHPKKKYTGMEHIKEDSKLAMVLDNRYPA